MAARFAGPGRPRLGLSWRLGPLRLYVPLVARARRVKVYRHDGCATDHLTYRDAVSCIEGDARQCTWSGGTFRCTLHAGHRDGHRVALPTDQDHHR